MATQSLGALAHASKTMAGVRGRDIESASVVGNPQHESVALDAEVQLRVRTSGVPHEVVYGLLEDEEYLSPNVCANDHVALWRGRVKPEAYLARGAHIADKLPHPL
jgi:hypothetical protein